MNPEELQGRPDDAIQAAADRRHLKPAAMLSHAEPCGNTHCAC
jgi:hypothetical protein